MIELPTTDAEPVRLVEGDCLATMRTLPDACVDLVLTDPPYFKVKGEWWDRQWDTPTEFVAWMGMLCDEWKRVLKPNGSLYVFASPQMAWHVEGAVRERFNVLQRVTWRKEEGIHWRQCEKELRNWFPQTEAIIFAEQYGADSMAKGEAGYEAKCDELRGFVFEPLRKYLVDEFAALGWNGDKLNEICGTASMAGRHYTARSQWCLPTAEHYAKLQEAAHGHLRREYGHLRREYGHLRREYEDLRREYEDLRRPFFATANRPYTDVWDFPTVGAYAGKHPCEKPLAMMEHIIETSSRPNALILDCFAGSGVVGEAARNYGRRALLCEIEPKWCNAIRRRLSQGDLFSEVLPIASHEESSLLVGVA